MKPGAKLQLFSQWRLDVRVSQMLEGSCFSHFSGLVFFKAKMTMLEAFLRTYDGQEKCFLLENLNERLYVGLQDIYFLTGLPVDGRPVVCGDKNLTHLCMNCLGRDDDRRRDTDGHLQLSWLRDNFATVPQDIDDQARLLPYVRAYLLFLIGTVILPDGEKPTVPILYLNFLEEVAADALNSYAWGAAVFAKLQICLDSCLVKWNLKGPTWVWEHFCMERITSFRQAYLGSDVPIPNEFPAFRGWSALMAHKSKNAHWDERWGEILRRVTSEDVVWQPYDRFGHPAQRIFFCQTIVFDYATIKYHMPEKAPHQLGIRVVDLSQLGVAKDLERIKKSKRGHLDRGLLVRYAVEINEWDRRYYSYINDLEDPSLLPGLPQDAAPQGPFPQAPPDQAPQGPTAQHLDPSAVPAPQVLHLPVAPPAAQDLDPPATLIAQDSQAGEASSTVTDSPMQYASRFNRMSNPLFDLSRS